jgi:hypothetical protein
LDFDTSRLSICTITEVPRSSGEELQENLDDVHREMVEAIGKEDIDVSDLDLLFERNF